MAQGTLIEMVRQVQAHGVGVPFYLAQSWIQKRYRQAAENHLWSFKIGDGQFNVVDEYTAGTVTMTNDSKAVTGASTTWTSAMDERQLKVGSLVFTITDFTSTTSLAIDRKWQLATASAKSYSILNAYITPAEADFHSFISVIDPVNGWRLRLGFTAMDLDRSDANRSSSSTPTILASRVYNASNVPMFELWPHPTAIRQYPYLYEKRVTDLSNPTDKPPPIIRSDVLVMGALADLSRWPGTGAQRNPFYDPYFNQYKSRESEFQQEVNKLKVADQEIYMTMLTYFTEMPYAPLDSKFLQNHAY